MRSFEQGALNEAIELLEYPAVPCEVAIAPWSGYAETGVADSPADGRTAKREAILQDAEIEDRISAEIRRSFEAGRERGLEEGRKSEREAHLKAQDAAQESRLRQAAELIANFAQERDCYLRSVEHEVVKLSLAVAARILRREAQMDPLLLTGAVRVALGQLSGSTEVSLRVPPAELELWREAIALLPQPALKPEIIAGEGMRLGDCVIETSLGSVDLGIRSQLAEIERGFFDQAGKHGVATKPSPSALVVGDNEE